MRLDIERCGQDLENLDSFIQTWYGEKDSLTGHDIIELKETLAYYLYELEKHRSDAHTDWNETMFEKKKSMSVNAAEIETNKEIPLLYRLRRIMEGADRVMWELKEKVSYLKKEMGNLN